MTTSSIEIVLGTGDLIIRLQLDDCEIYIYIYIIYEFCCDWIFGHWLSIYMTHKV